MENFLFLKEETIKAIFKIGLIIKWIIASSQIIGGLLLLFVSKNIITNGIILLTQGELLEDPQDYVATYILQQGTHFLLDVKFIIAIYLLIHGLVKFYLLYGLWKSKLGAYPLSIGVFSLFLIYQMYLYWFNHSAWLLVLSIFDIVYIYLILHEYRILKKD